MKLPDLPPRQTWEPHIQGGDEIQQEGPDGHATAYGERGTLLRARVQRAREILQRDVLAPDKRRELQAFVADNEDEAAVNIERGLEAFKQAPRRLAEFQTKNYPSFVAWAEEHVARVVEAAAELEGPLQAYLDAWDDAAAAWGSFTRATISTIEADDASRGVSRASDTVRNEASLPDCPLPLNSIELVQTVMPRPRVFSD